MSRQINAHNVRFEGCTFDGYYAVASNMVTVWNPSLGSRSAKIGDASVPALVDALLLEIVQECTRYRGVASNGTR
jgi:hypothetical protein